MVTRERADGTEATQGSHDEIRPVYRKTLADRTWLAIFRIAAFPLFLEKSHNYTEYLMLDEQDRLIGFRCSPVASERVQGNLTPCAEPNFDALPQTSNENEDRSFDVALGGDSAQRVGVMRLL